MRKWYWFEPIGGGMNQRIKPTQIKFSEAKLLYNISHDRIGSWYSTKGRNLLANIGGSGTGRGIGVYKKRNGTEEIWAVNNGNLYNYSVSFGLIESSVFTSTANINFVNYLNRLYMFSDNASDNVTYTTGSTTTDVGATGNEIQAKYGVAAQDSLWAANVASLEDRVYVSLYDIANNTPTHQFYDSADTMATSKRYFIMDGYITGVTNFKDYCLVFTNHSVWRPDVRSVGTLRGAEKLLDVGTTSHRSIAVDNKLGVMMWADSNRGVYLWTGAGDPTNVGEFIIERISNSGLLDTISSSNYGILAGVIYDGKYYLSVGNLTDTTTDYYQNACFVYDIVSNKWSVKGAGMSDFALWKQTNTIDLFGLSSGGRSVYQMETGTQDDDSSGTPQDITSIIQTKDLRGEFGPGGSEKTFHNLITLYSGTATVGSKYSLNGEETYTTIGNLQNESTTANVSMSLQPIERNGQSISLEWRKTSGTMEIVAFGLEVETHDYIAIRSI